LLLHRQENSYFSWAVGMEPTTSVSFFVVAGNYKAKHKQDIKKEIFFH
jgi:hypothetical protein